LLLVGFPRRYVQRFLLWVSAPSDDQHQRHSGGTTYATTLVELQARGGLRVDADGPGLRTPEPGEATLPSPHYGSNGHPLVQAWLQSHLSKRRPK